MLYSVVLTSATQQHESAISIHKTPVLSNLILDKGGKNIQWRKDSSSTREAGETDQLHVKE